VRHSEPAAASAAARGSRSAMSWSSSVRVSWGRAARSSVRASIRSLVSRPVLVIWPVSSMKPRPRILSAMVASVAARVTPGESVRSARIRLTAAATLYDPGLVRPRTEIVHVTRELTQPVLPLTAANSALVAGPDCLPDNPICPV